MLLLVFVLRPSWAPGQEFLAPVENAPAKFAGRLFLNSVRGQDEAHRGIVALDPNDGTWRKIYDTGPVRISPDGRRLAHNRLGPGEVDPGLWISMTSGEPESYRASERRGSICWSHDGTSVFVTSRNQGELDVWRVHLDGTPEERLPFHPPNPVLDQSTDGILLLTNAGYDNKIRIGISLIRPDGTGSRELLSGSKPTFDFKGYLYAPRFSLDGRFLLAGFRQMVVIPATEEQPSISFKPFKAGLWEMDVLSGRSRRFQERDVYDGALTSPCWSPDGKAIAGRTYSAPLDGSGSPPRSSLVIVDSSGAVLKTTPWPEDLLNFRLFEWK